MKVYTATYYEFADSVFLGVYSTPEKAIETLKRLYKENKDEGFKYDYVVSEFELDKEAKSPKTISLQSWEEMKPHGNIFEN